MQLTVGKVRQKSSELLPLKELSPVHLTNTEKQTECKEISGGTFLVLVK